MLDTCERSRMVEALHAGARGLLAKNSDHVAFLKAIHCVHKGELWVGGEVLGAWATSTVRRSKPTLQLTSREREIVGQILAGSSNREIAGRFTITEHTVKRHLSNIYEKLGCATRLELCLFAMHNHLFAEQ
jgi:two-component system, NarL family, nitrate/nitrite response regulator NarL